MQGPMSVLNVVTVPPGAGLGQRIVIDGFRGAIFEYDASNNLIGSWASTSGTDPYGNSYPQGLSITGSGIFSGTIIAGNISNTPIGSSSITNSDFNNGTIEDTIITFDANGGQIFVYSSTLTTQTFTTAGTTVFNAPAGVTSITAQCWGAGGGGGGAQLLTAGTGGGGGEFAKDTVAVTPGNNYNVVVGTGGAGGIAGQPSGGHDGTASSFTGDTAAVTAHQGTGGTNSNHGNGGAAGLGGKGSNNAVHFNGGNGGQGDQPPTDQGAGGGGGAAAGTSNAGNKGGNATSSSAGAGGSGKNGGGSGGNGGNGADGSGGSAPGGGGGAAGAGRTNTHNGGAGANGQVILQYQTGRSLIGSWSAAGGTDQYGNTFPKGMMIDAINGPVVALDPVAGNKPETWHLMSLASGWSNVSGQVSAQYRMLPDGTVQTVGSISHASFTTTQTILGTAVPTVYRPTNRVWVSGNNPGDTSLDVTTNGLFGADIGNLASATTCRWNGTYPLGI